MTADKNLSATEATQEQLGWIKDRIAAWAGMDVLLFTRNDIAPFIPEEMMVRIGDPDDGYVDSITDPPRLLESFHAFAGQFPEFPAGSDPATERQHHKLLRGMVVKAIEGLAASTTVPGDDSAKAIILSTPLNFTAKEHATHLIGIPASQLQNIPGEGREWLTMILGHEAAHCAHSLKHTPIGQTNMLIEETAADQFAINNYFNEMANGNVHTKAVPEAFIAIRSLTSVVNFNFQHATSIYLSLPESETRMNLELPPQHQGIEESRAFMKTIYEHIAKTTGASGKEVLLLTRDQPELIYESVRQLTHDNAFEGPYQKAYAAEFLENAEKYAPAYFKIGEPRATPPAAPGIPAP